MHDGGGSISHQKSRGLTDRQLAWCTIFEITIKSFFDKRRLNFHNHWHKSIAARCKNIFKKKKKKKKTKLEKRRFDASKRGQRQGRCTILFKQILQQSSPSVRVILHYVIKFFYHLNANWITNTSFFCDCPAICIDHFSFFSTKSDRGASLRRISSRWEKQIAGNCRTRHFVRTKEGEGGEGMERLRVPIVK